MGYFSLCVNRFGSKALITSFNGEKVQVQVASNIQKRIIIVMTNVSCFAGTLFIEYVARRESNRFFLSDFPLRCNQTFI